MPSIKNVLGKGRVWYLRYIIQTAHSRVNMGVVYFRVVLEILGVHDRLHIYPLCGIFYFPWHRHQIEGTSL